MKIESLCDGDLITLPSIVTDSFVKTLSANGLLEKAQAPRAKKGPIGGLTKEATDEHFCQSYDGSLARTAMVYLNPTGDLAEAAKTLRRYLIGGKLCLIDMPAGAGAGAICLLGCIAHLREIGELPRHPLEVLVIWPEISKFAVDYGMSMLTDLEPKLNEQGITIRIQFREWDILDDVSNTELIEDIVKSKSQYAQILMLACNFSGFLGRDEKWKKAHSNLSAIFKFCSGDMNAALWIEPNTKLVRNKFFETLDNFINKLPSFARLLLAHKFESSEARFVSPTINGLNPRVSAFVLPIDLVKANKKVLKK